MTNTKKKGGRPCLLDKAKPKIIKALKVGATYKTACQSAKVSYRSFRTWMIRGEQDHVNGLDTIFSQFFQEVEEAEAEGELVHWEALNKAATGGEWKAAFAFLRLKQQERPQKLIITPDEAIAKPKDNVPLVGVKEFITSPDYLGKASFWPKSLDLLEQALEPGILGFILEWGLGGGKSFFASALLGYLLYKTAYDEVILGVNVRERVGLANEMKIAFVNTSLNQRNSKEVVFDVLQSFVKESPWFKEYLPYNPRVTSKLEFANGYSVFPGTGKIGSIVGYSVKGGVQDEANLFENSSDGNKGTDYADEMYTEMHNRIFSRWGDDGYFGLLSARRTVRDFTARKRSEYLEFPEVSKQYFMPPAQTSWGNWPEKRNQVTATGNPKRWRRFDTQTLQWVDSIEQAVVFENIIPVVGGNRIWVPEDFWIPFTVRPEEAMRDLASVPSETLAPFFRKSAALRPDFELVNPILPGVAPQDWMRPGIKFDELVSDDFYGDKGGRYCFHVDLSRNLDATGFALAHKSGIDKILLNDSDRRPEKAILIDVDLALQIKALPGEEIEYAQIRRLIKWLRDKRGFRLERGSFDGFQSVDSQQILKKDGIKIEEFSMDRNLTGYSTLKDGLYEGRVFLPCAHGQTEKTTMEQIRGLARKGDSCAVLQVELHELQLVDGKKADHPADGTKDVSDAVAGAVTQVQRKYAAPQEKLSKKRR